MANQTIYPYGPNGQLPSGIGVVNDVETGGTTDALSAEQGKNLGYDVQLLVEQLADSAFIGERPDLKDVRTAISTTVTVTIETSHATVSNEKTSCVLGASYKNSVLNERGYVISSVTVTMGGVDITSSCYDSGARTIVIDEVTGNITIACTAVENTNPHYYQLRYHAADNGVNYVTQDSASLLSKYYAITPGYEKVITFNSGSVSRLHPLICFNDDETYHTYWLDNSSPRTVTVNSGVGGLRLNSTYSLIPKAILVNSTDNETYFDGSKFYLNDSIDGIRYFDRFANNNGDLVGVMITANGLLQSGVFTTGSTEDWITSKLIPLPSGSKNVIFSVGEVDSSCMLICLQNEDAINSTYTDYFIANADPRTVSLSSRYNYVRLLCKKSQYVNAYVKIGDDILWQGTNEFVE